MVGGYQIIDFKGLSITSGQTYPLVDAKKADIFRNTNKPIYMRNIVLNGELNIDGWLYRGATGAEDGSAYMAQIGDSSITFATNGDIVSILVNE